METMRIRSRIDVEKSRQDPGQARTENVLNGWQMLARNRQTTERKTIRALDGTRAAHDIGRTNTEAEQAEQRWHETEGQQQ